MEEETVYLKQCTLLSDGRYCSPLEDPNIKTSLVWWGRCVSYANHSFFYDKERLLPSYKISNIGWVSWHKLKVAHLEDILSERKYSTRLKMHCNYIGFYGPRAGVYINSLRRMLYRKRAQICFDCNQPICEDNRR